MSTMRRESESGDIVFSEAVRHVTELKLRIMEVIFGQEELITEALCCFLSGGHILITGAPGLAKTTLVRVIAKNLGLQFGRIQFTPDLLPSDIVGCEILNVDPENQQRSFVFSAGPVFANFILADEINRASPRTQSALLEAMQERRVTVAGKDYELPLPFMVFATQNPFESEGTFPLPEAQLDRFLLHANVFYPDDKAELQILHDHAMSELVGESGHPSKKNQITLNPKLISHLIASTQKIMIADELLQAINELIRSTRPGDPNCPEHISSGLWYGAGPRAGISLISVSRALALIEGKQAVSWHEIRRLAKPTLRHRMRLTLTATRDRLNVDEAIEELLQRLESRHANLAKGMT